MKRTGYLNLLNLPASARKRKYVYLLLAYVIIALLSPLLANHDPLYLRIGDRHYFPALSRSPYIEVRESGNWLRLRKDAVDWRTFPADSKWMAPVVYSADENDLMNASFVSPFATQRRMNTNGQEEELPLRYRHWLGTTRTGADVLSGLIHGAGISLLIGLLSVLLSAFIGLTVGTVSAWYGNGSLKISRASLLFMLLGALPVWFWCVTLRAVRISDAFADSFVHGSVYAGTSLGCMLLCFLLLARLGRLVHFLPFLRKKIALPVDSILSTVTEFFVSIPRLVLLITLASIARPSLSTLICLIGISSWTGTARMQRSEILRLKNEGYTDAARALGLGTVRILFKHLLPVSLRVTGTTLIFGFASAILTEAGLSFIGIGVPPGTGTWGTLLAGAREQFSAWWLVIFPGALLFLLVWSLHRITERDRSFSDAY